MEVHSDIRFCAMKTFVQANVAQFESFCLFLMIKRNNNRTVSSKIATIQVGTTHATYLDS